MKKKLSLPLILVCLLLGPARSAVADWTPFVGLPGPAPFVTYCKNQGSLVGLHVRAGNFIDAIQGDCLLTKTPWFGGSGGASVDLLCGSGTMKGVNSWWGDFVAGLQVACYSSSASSWVYSGWAGTVDDNFSSLRCASGYWAKGFKGETGDLVDRLSIFCAR